MPRATALALNAVMIPAFSRQTGLACSACHYQFPQLTPFGRQFKLNGYVFGDNKPLFPLALMVQGGYSHTSADQPDDM